MRVFVLNGKRVFFVILLISIFVSGSCIAYISKENSMGVFSNQRDLPIYSVETSSKNVSITFDCAWGADDIPQILSALEKENIKATFFIIGQWAEKNPEVVKMIANSGHDIANHSYSHLRMGSIDDSKIKDEISKCHSKLKDITGNRIDLFRAPYGDYNNNVVAIARSLGYYTIQWDVDSLDWKPGINQEDIMNRIVSKVKNGSIILFHNDTPHTAAMLPGIISALKNNGYGFEPVSKLILREDCYIDHDGTQKRNK